MEVLRKAIERLSAPICSECDAEMVWSRSELNAGERVIKHVFACPRCDALAETTTPLRHLEE